MPVALTCDCGARFEVDETQAGQEVHCPECLQALAPPTKPPAPRLSFHALASLVLALVGAFTLVGTLAAILVGAYALVKITTQRDRLCGVGYACAGVVLGVVFTLLTLVGLWRSDLVPVSAWLRQRVMAGLIDTSGALEVVSSDGSCSLTRPSLEWGRVRGDASDDPAVSDLQKNADLPLSLDLLLIHPGRHAYVDVHRDTRTQPATLSLLTEQLHKELTAPRKPLLTEEDGPLASLQAQLSVQEAREIPPIDGREGREWRMQLSRGGQKWSFLVRAYRKQNPDPRGIDPIHIVRAYCLTRRFKANEPELRQLLDSFRFLR